MTQPNLSHRYLILECVLVFVLFPFLMALAKPRGLIYVTLWVAMVLCLFALKKYPDYDFRKDWNNEAINWANIKPLLVRFVPFAVLLVAFMLVVIPEHFLSLPRRGLGLWAMVMVLYPALSVIPQEFIFRSFFMKRYLPIIHAGLPMIIINALVFGWVHVVLLNWVAILFSAAGGALFAHTYLKHRSIALCFFEHALYGCFIFTIGMGQFFYHGAAVR